MSDLAAIHDVLGKGGVLSRRLAGFRERESQLRMAGAVHEALQRGGPLLVEAPTGVGKSLAYLVPLLLGPVAAGQRAVVATHTIALQDQLLTKDLPLLAASLPVEFTAVKAVGRSNYLGLRRMHQALAQAPTLVVDDEGADLRRVAAWSKSTPEGLRTELDPPPLARVWEEVQSESDNCLGRLCPHHQDCFAWAARRRVESADLIIANHALVLADLAARQAGRGILPDYSLLVVDEAHHLADVAADQLGVEVRRRDVLRALVRLGGRGGRGGQLARLLGAEAKGFEKDHLEELRLRAQVFFEEIDDWCATTGTKNGRYAEPGIFQDPLSEPLDRLAARLTERAEVAKTPEVSVELLALADRTRGLAMAVRAVVQVEDRSLVHWAESAPESGHTALFARPLEVGQTLAESLFAKKDAVILTSATLSSDASASGLKPIAQDLGLRAAEGLVLPSPFRHREQVRAWIARGMPPPESPQHDLELVAWIVAAIRHSGGGAFVLFTSYKALDSAWRRAVQPLEADGRLVLRQAQGVDRSQLLARFRADGHAVLFGTESFWEGVDVPGSALRLVIITRLPFPVPTTPLNEARSERLTRAGRDPFREASLPVALLKFRQGFGRLIRAEDDRGAFLCLDSRLCTKSYGAAFRRAVGPLDWVELDRPEFDASALPLPKASAQSPHAGPPPH